MSGLKFGHAELNPYRRHQLPWAPSMNGFLEQIPHNNFHGTHCLHEHVFRGGQGGGECHTGRLRATFKVFIGSELALGLDQTKKKISLLLWVLLKNKEQWETFPWGSYSYQLLVDSICSVVRWDRETKSGKICYHINENTKDFLVSVFSCKHKVFVNIWSKHITDRVYFLP